MSTSVGTMERLSGTLSALRRTRQQREFVLEQIGGAGVAPTAIAAALSGMGGAAIGIATMETGEEADHIEGEIDGMPFKGWFWRFPFRNGDVLTLSGQRNDGVFHALAAQRQEDGLLAVHPHCTRGRRAHWKSSFSFWLKVFAVLYGLSMAFMLAIVAYRGDPPMGEVLWFLLAYGLPVCALIFGFLAYRSAVKLKGFAVIAESIFAGFGWPSPTTIDLPARSKGKKREGDSNEFGYKLFRY